MKRWITKAALWWLGPPKPKKPLPETVVCAKCKRSVNAWRNYADGRTECIPCASGLKHAR